MKLADVPSCLGGGDKEIDKYYEGVDHQPAGDMLLVESPRGGSNPSLTAQWNIAQLVRALS